MSQHKYLVTARKYRPQLFDELVAQEHVSGTLKNAIRLDRMAHAYLFSGPRGVGKTTAARILAKAINCTTPLEERADEAEPCRTCESCRAFEEGRSLNIFEIDAASNNKVEDIRELRETVRVPPQGSRKKVYIIDEVHMLSNAAFNALLKTLEEPPPYVLFIFATTEPHKVLPTILSRCQRFDFRRIAVPEIVGRLRSICEEEDITADEASLMLIARKGDGALRDALSVFDQAVSLCGTDLRYDDLAQALGVVDVDLFFEVTDRARARDSAGLLQLVERIVRAGYDLQEFLDGLAEHLRNLLVGVTMPDAELIEATEAMRTRYLETAAAHTEADLLRLLMVVAEAEEALKNSTQPRLRLEMALLRMASLAHVTDLQQALQQLDRLEELARDGKLPEALPAAAPEPAVPERKRPQEPPTKPQPQEPPVRPDRPGPPAPGPERPRRPSQPPRVPDPPKTPDVPTPQPTPTPAPNEPIPTRAEADGQPVGDDQPVADDKAVAEPSHNGTASTERPADEQSTTDEPPRSDDDGGLPEGDSAPPEPPAPASSPAPPKTAPAEDASPSYPSLFGPPALPKKPRSGGNEGDGAPQNALAAEALVQAEPTVVAVPTSEVGRYAKRWARYVEVVKKARIHVGAMLQQSTPTDVQGSTLVVAVPDDFHHRLLSSQGDFLNEHLAELGGAVEALQFIVQEDAAPAAAVETEVDFDPYEYMQRKREEDPVVRALFDQFGGELVW